MDGILSFAGKYALYIVFGILVINSLPSSPMTQIKTYLASHSSLIQPIISAVNWFLPIQEMTSTFLAYLGVMSVLQILLVVGRMTGIFKT